MADDIVTRGQHYYRDDVDGWMARTEWGAMQVDECAAALLDEIERLRYVIGVLRIRGGNLHDAVMADRPNDIIGSSVWRSTLNAALSDWEEACRD